MVREGVYQLDVLAEIGLNLVEVLMGVLHQNRGYVWHSKTIGKAKSLAEHNPCIAFGLFVFP